MKEIIVVDNVTKTFSISKKQRKIEKTNERVKVAVNGLSLTTYEGEIYGLLGPNGSGKTTTLRIMSTLIKADSGSVTIKGIDVLKNPDLVRKNIAFLTSELKLEEFFTPNYLIEYYGKLYGLDEEVINKRRMELFSRFGIDKFAEVKVGELSTGMKQKTSLAISMVHNADVIIFDEPTNGLDVLTAKVVTDFLEELKREGKSIIISTHIFSLIEKVCDRVGVIINGKMIKEGTIEDVKNGMSLEDAFFNIYKEEVGEE